jgi:hypothetical protein
MNYLISPEHLTEALARAHQHWEERHGVSTSEESGVSVFYLGESRRFAVRLFPESVPEFGAADVQRA